VIENIENHKNSSKMTQLESAQDFVWKQFVEIIGKISSSQKYEIEMESFDSFETVNDQDIKCTCAHSRIEITNR